MSKNLLALFIATVVSGSAYAETFANADVSLTPAGDFVAKCDDVSGFATMKGDSVSAENIVVKMASLKTGISLRDKHARDKFLEVGKYPTFTLLKAVGKGGKGTGRVSYRGVEKDVAGTYSIKGNFLEAMFPIKLSEFNVKGIKYMGVGVDDDVKIHVSVPLKK
jgi:polyisoprenoid-binding protein YceI